MIFTLTMAVFLSLFSTAVMSYIAMATPIGPWIGPTLVLLGIPLYRIFIQNQINRSLAMSVIAGSLGGIIATALGFSFPTLYFLDPHFFNAWISVPFYFCSFLTFFVLIAGLCAFWFTDYFHKKFLDEQQLSFPIGQVMHSMIASHSEIKQSYSLFSGVALTAVFCLLQDGICAFKGIIPKTITLLTKKMVYGFTIPLLVFDLWPMLWAIGFVTGHVIAVPLAIGACAQIFLTGPLHYHFFKYLSSVEFTLAFCSGMVVAGAFFAFLGLPSMVVKLVRSRQSTMDFSEIKKALQDHWIMGALALGTTVLFFSYYRFSVLAQCFIMVSTLVWTYQTVFVAGKVGLATLGRYATFVMIPAMMLFKLNYLQIVIVATFVELVGGITVDLFFGRKLAALSRIDHRMARRWQLLGILISALCIGFVFWALITHFGLGSEKLVAYRAQSRQLLINVQQFDYIVLCLGFLFGVILKYTHVNPALVLGGLLMPLNLSIGLIFGGFLSLLTSERVSWEPFFSGIFAYNALWMLIKVFC